MHLENYFSLVMILFSLKIYSIFTSRKNTHAATDHIKNNPRWCIYPVFHINENRRHHFKVLTHYFESTLSSWNLIKSNYFHYTILLNIHFIFVVSMNVIRLHKIVKNLNLNVILNKPHHLWYFIFGNKLTG